MGNNLSQDLNNRHLPHLPRSKFPIAYPPQTDAFRRTSADIYVHNPSFDQVNKCRSIGVNTNDNVYAKSCLYRRKIYSQSLPKLKTPSRLPPLSLPKTPLPLLQTSRVMEQSSRPLTSSSALSARHFILSPLKEAPLLDLCNQQWNGNNWADVGEENYQESGPAIIDIDAPTTKLVRPLPKLLPVHRLMEKLDDELSKSKNLLRKTVDELTDTDKLIGRNMVEQQDLIRKTEESVLSTQTLLAKLHQHIANAHEFCNLLHRADESLQFFSKAAYWVSKWDDGKFNSFKRAE
ncbi:hypothetical protein Aperf_G00000008866 [Anoplocephala perfoliata]